MELTAKNLAQRLSDIQASLGGEPAGVLPDTYIIIDSSQAHMRLAADAVARTEPHIGKKAARRDTRTAAAIAAGRKTFAQLREEAAAQNPDRYASRNLGTRKTGMLGASPRRGK